MQRVPYDNSETPGTETNAEGNTLFEPEPVVATNDFKGTPGQAELAIQVRRLIDLTARSRLSSHQYDTLMATIRVAVDTVEDPLRAGLVQHGSTAEEMALVNSKATNLPPERDPLDFLNVEC